MASQRWAVAGSRMRPLTCVANPLLLLCTTHRAMHTHQQQQSHPPHSPLPPLLILCPLNSRSLSHCCPLLLPRSPALCRPPSHPLCLLPPTRSALQPRALPAVCTHT